jgi:pimeloyl-ACP methyl ester carboxylesterase
VVSIDIRGHGNSDKPLALAPYSYPRMSQDVWSVMDALAIEQAGFIGYAMGSFIGA